MVMIRLLQMGAKKNLEFAVVVVDKAKKRDGGVLQRVGFYYPKAKTNVEKVKLDTASIQAWIAKGAQCSETVGQLVKIAEKAS